MKASSRLYYNNYFLGNINNSKKFWNGIKERSHFGPKISHIIVKIIYNETELTDPAKTGGKCFHISTFQMKELTWLD